MFDPTGDQGIAPTVSRGCRGDALIARLKRMHGLNSNRAFFNSQFPIPNSQFQIPH